MKKNLLLLILLLLLFIPSCSRKRIAYKTLYLDEAFSIMPTVTIMEHEETLNNIDITNDLNNILQELDLKFNVHDSNSLINEVNRNSGIQETTVDDEFIYILKEAIKISIETKKQEKSLYDVTIYPIWKEWNFTDNYYIYNNYSNVPTQDIIKQKLPLVNFQNIIINENNKTIFLKEKGMMIDLGSIVKGYAADKIYNYLYEHSLYNCLIDIGGNIITMGKNIGTEENWKAGILMPYSYDTEIGYIKTNEQKETLVTSGIYERYIVHLNKQTNKEEIYHHILNPLTGYPEDNELLSVTIITNNSLKADGYSTAIFLMGLNEGIKFVNNNESIEAIFITKNKEIYLSANIKNRFIVNEEVLNQGYVLK